MNLHINKYGQGFPLVFFHGWGFDSQIWLPLVEKLAVKYQLILVDLPGFGLSPAMEWTIFKEKLLSQLPDKFALTGWSMGGLYAMRLAIEAPERVASLLNITASPRFIMDDSWPGVRRSVFSEFYKKLATDVQATLNEFIGLQIDTNKMPLAPGYPPSSEGLESGLKILDFWDLREGLHDFDKPVCFMFGRLDPIVPIKTMQVMQQRYPDFHYVLFPRAAHMPFLSHRDEFIEKLVEFIQ